MSIRSILTAVAASAVATTAMAAGSISHSDASWTWGDPVPNAGSQLVRSANGLSATFIATGLTPGDAVTLWFIVFNHPENCFAGPGNCGPFDLFNPDAGADFHYGVGNVVGASGKATFAARLNVGDTSRSGLVEVGEGGAVPLQNVSGAEVLLALHSHGPKLMGLELKAQLSSFLGGCGAFVGDAFGWATGPGDLPLARNHCSTIQLSRHAVP